MGRKWIVLPAACLIAFLSTAAQAADQDKIQQAIARGVKHLRSKQDKSAGTWSFHEVGGGDIASPIGPVKIGATAMAGVTLLECGVPADDPQVQKAARAVRRASVGLTQTYELSAAILFLDRLGDPDNAALIQSMAVRLLGGQNSSGGWSYTCPPLAREETARLTAHLRKTDNRSTTGSRSRASAREPRPMPSDIDKQLSQVNPGAMDARMGSDNSNTKFATLALWVARRHGVPVEKSLKMVERRFRDSQNPDGGWGYMVEGPNGRGRFRGGPLDESLGSMTCAGLLGLATGQGVANESTLRTDPRAGAPQARPRPAPRNIEGDPAIQAGLRLLAQLIGNENASSVPLFLRRHGDVYYFLWALERVAVAYGLQTVGATDWYAWGSDLLLTKQARDGGWHGQYEGGVDTCFALLFLTRANLARDLTVSLRGELPDSQPPGAAAKRAPAPTAKTEMPDKTSARPPTPVQRKETEAPSRTPPAQPEASDDLERETARLASALVNGDRSRQTKLLDQYQSSKGVAYTQALAAAIPKLDGAVQAKARDALADRLTRMTASTLRIRLKDENPEIRRAAALACAMKEERDQVPDIIDLLEDDDPGVVRAAHAALKSLTGKDLGPAPGATKQDRSTSKAAWKSWWNRQKTP